MEWQAKENIERIMEEIKPFIKKYRFLAWAESKSEGENNGLGITDMRGVKQATLDEGYKILTEGGDIDRWLSKQSFGVIEKGYIPRVLLGGIFKFPLYHISFLSRGLIKPRLVREDLSDLLLFARVDKYVNAVLNLKYLEAPIREFDKDLLTLHTHNNIPHENVVKIQTWVDTLKSWHTAKTGLNIVLKTGTRWMHRTIAARPKLWIRNPLQPYVLTPFKRPLYHPASAFKTLKDLPEEARQFFELHTTQMDAMLKEYMYFLEEEAKKMPKLSRRYVEIVEEIGRVYALTDLWNRIKVYSSTWWYVHEAMEKFQKSKKTPQDFRRLKNNSGFHLMRPGEQERFLRLLEENPEQATIFAADWNTIGGQWAYKLKERCLDELYTNIPTIYNLFVWPRSLAQSLLGGENKILHGRNLNERWNALLMVLGILIAGEIANKLLQRVYGRYKVARYQGYSILQAVVWSFGGATVGSLNDFTDAISGVIFAYSYGTETEKRRSLLEAARVIDRAANLFVPFMDSGLAVAETITGRKYISPLYDVLARRKLTSKDYIDRSTMQKVLHAFFRQVRIGEQEARELKAKEKKGVVRTKPMKVKPAGGKVIGEIRIK